MSVITAAVSQARARGTQRWFVVIKIGVAATTFLALLSLGGLMMFAFPVLVTGHLWAFRRAHMVERSLWVVLAVVSAAEWAWEVAYPSTGNSSAWQWLTVAVAMGVTVALFVVIDRRAARPAR